MANPFKVIGRGIKKFFGWIVAGVRWVFSHTEIDEFLAEYFLQIVEKARELALNRSLSNAARRDALAAFILALAKTAKVVIAEHVVNLVVELAVARLKGSIRPE